MGEEDVRMKDEQLEELLEGHRPDVKRAIRAAFAAAEGDTNDPYDDFVALSKLGHVLAGGAAPPVAVIIAAVGAAVSLLRWQQKKRRKRINKSRRDGMSAGLNAARSSKFTSAMMRKRPKGRTFKRRPWRD